MPSNNFAITRTLLTLALCTALTQLAFAQHRNDTAPTLQTGTRIVAVDVTVTDNQGNPVHGLPASAFHVYEDGRPEALRHFAEHSFQPNSAKPLPPLPPGEFTNAVPHIYGDTLNVVVLDTLNTRPQDQMYVHQQVEKYLTHARPGAQIALLEITTHLVLLQSFTSDPQILLAALKNTDSFAVSPLLGGSGGRGTAEVRGQMREDYTADSFRQLDKYLSSIPGKKNVIYFSDGNSYGYGPDGLTDVTTAGVFDVSPFFDQAQYLVSASQLSFAYIDAHGLATNGAFNASRGGYSRGAIERGNDRIINRELYDEQFADAMGGQAFLNTNDLAGAMGHAIVSGSNYYSFDYHPSGYQMDGGYHRIRVSLNNPMYRLVYRHGYDATAPSQDDASLQATNGSDPASAESLQTQSPIRKSMQRGWPEMNQILYREHFVPLGTRKGGSETNELAPGSTKNPHLKSQFRNFDVTFTANISNIQPTVLPNGKMHIRVEFLVLTYNDQSLLQTAITKELDGNVTFAELTRLQQTGLQLTMPFSTPAKGNYYVRTGIHDMTSDHIGTLEVPKSMIDSLSPENKTAKQ